MIFDLSCVAVKQNMLRREVWKKMLSELPFIASIEDFNGQKCGNVVRHRWAATSSKWISLQGPWSQPQ